MLQEELEYPAVRESLAAVGLDDVFTVLTGFITDESRLSQYVADSLVNTDNHPYLAYYNPMQKVRDALIIPRVLGIFGELSLPVFPYLVNMREAETEIKTTLENRSRARSHVIQAIAYEYQLDFTNAIYELENALAITPEDNNIKNSLELAQAIQLAQAERLAYPYVAEGQDCCRPAGWKKLWLFSGTYRSFTPSLRWHSIAWRLSMTPEGSMLKQSRS